MYSRRGLLIAFCLFTPLLSTPFGLLKKIYSDINIDNHRRRKFLKNGWLLQQGDI
jgi:hypothetical protein